MVHCEQLKAVDSNGLSDPFVKFKVGNEKVKSSVHKKTLNPVFNEKFFLFVGDDNNNDGKDPRTGAVIRLLKIEVYDWDRLLPNTLIGTRGIDICTLKPGIRV